ncbi:MAG: hypothetical protein OXL34_05970 [Gemmatimonadota bacterium]|nr:hypothetical protein [Gemmatimonadota bacterium]
MPEKESQPPFATDLGHIALPPDPRPGRIEDLPAFETTILDPYLAVRPVTHAACADELAGSLAATADGSHEPPVAVEDPHLVRL